MKSGEVLADYVRIKYSVSKRRFIVNLMDARVDQKKLQSVDCPFSRLFARQAEHGASSDAEKIQTKYMRSSSDISSRREDTASPCGIKCGVSGEEFVRDNGSLLSLQPWIFKRAKSSKTEEDSDASVCWSFDWGFSHGSPRRISPSSNWIGSKKRQDRYNFRPITPAENIFMPHLCSEKVAVEEYTFNFHHLSHVKEERLSCLIPNSSRETSGAIVNSLVHQPENRHGREIGPSISSEKNLCFAEICDSVNEELTTVIGVPHLPPRKLKNADIKSREAFPTSLDTSSFQKLCKISDALGSLDGMLLFLLGITVGVASSVLSNKIEVENLKKLLKDNKNLVQDLHEELEMKDLLTVKDLGNETDGNKELEHNDLDISIDAFQNSKWDATSLKIDDHMAKNEENPEALSEIEAELEAELERLEQNINACNIGQTTSAFIELQLDSDLIADAVQGEFREDLLINGGREYPTDDEDGKDACTSDTARPYNSNFSVSPKELSIRLHRVIESRLEERIKELESALEQCQLKLRLVEAERLSSKPPFSSSDAGSSNQDGSECLKQIDPSLRSELAGDALTAYDEAYEEFSRLAETKDEKFPSVDMKEQAWEQIVWRTGSYEISGTEEEDDEDEDDDSFDEGKDLIQRIVEKTKQGSPALLNAQRMLFLMDL